MSSSWVELMAMFVTAVFGASGFWAWLTNRRDKNSAANRLMLGMAHDRIVEKGLGYIDRGWISKDEYEDFFKYLYDEYAKFGGNGLAEKVAKGVKDLPMRNVARHITAPTPIPLKIEEKH